MSRGRGRAQNFILSTLEESRAQPDPGPLTPNGRIWPLPALAATYAHRLAVPNTAHLRSSLRRAARRLAHQQAVTLLDVLLPTRVGIHMNMTTRRKVLCVTLPDATEFSRRDIDDAAALMVMAEPKPTAPLTHPLLKLASHLAPTTAAD